jgi:hydroxypyruvate isomerase
MNKSELVESILAMNDTDTKEVAELLNARMAQSTVDKINKYRVGQKVQFDYHGQIITGIVMKLNRKTLNVTSYEEVDGSKKWRVPPEMIFSCDKSNLA